MNNNLNPCKCGYAGPLAGESRHGFLALICPECLRTVEGFTLEGLALSWNKANPQPRTEGGEGDD